MDKDDATSVFRLVHQWSNNPDFDSPVCYYKPCGESNDDTSETIPAGSEVPLFSKTDFLLVFQTREQAMMFLENDRVLLGDGTHGITGYGCFLLTLMVLNMWGQGLSVAWGISSKENHRIWYIFGKSLRPESLQAKPEVWMSDDTNSSWNGLIQVWTTLQHKLLCHFHIKKSVRKKCGCSGGKKKEVIIPSHHCHII